MDHLSILQYLLFKKAKVYTVNSLAGSYRTPLHYAAENGYIRIVECLLAHGIAINSKMISGETALHVAAENGHHEIVQLLINNMAQVNQQDYFERTPLFLASSNNHILAVKTLLNHNVDINIAEIHDLNLFLGGIQFIFLLKRIIMKFFQFLLKLLLISIPQIIIFVVFI